MCPGSNGEWTRTSGAGELCCPVCGIRIRELGQDVPSLMVPEHDRKTV